MSTVTHRRLLVHTRTISTTIIRRGGTINVRSTHGTLHGSGRHHIKGLDSVLTSLNINHRVSHTNQVIGSRRAQVLRRYAHSTRTLLLPTQSANATLTRVTIGTTSTVGRLIRTYHPTNARRLLINNVKHTPLRILTRNAHGRRILLRRSARNVTRNGRIMVTRVTSTRRCNTFNHIMRTHS